MKDQTDLLVTLMLLIMFVIIVVAIGSCKKREMAFECFAKTQNESCLK